MAGWQTAVAQGRCRASSDSRRSQPAAVGPEPAARPHTGSQPAQEIPGIPGRWTPARGRKLPASETVSQMLPLAQLLALSAAQPQPQPHFHRCGPDHDAECSAFSLLSEGSCAGTPGCAPILDEAECRALHSQVDLVFREGSGHFVVGSAQRDSVAAGCLFFAGGGHREGGRHKFNANAASSAACGERTQCICRGGCAPLAANAAPHAVVDHTGSSEPGGHAGSRGRMGPAPTPTLPPVVGERQLQRAWLQLVVSTPAATLAGHKAQHGGFERSLQKDIRDALSVRPEGRIDVRNISFESLSPYRGERGERDNVSAAKVSVVWCCDTVDAEDVRTAIMVRFMPNGTRAPSECGIDMTTPGAVTILQVRPPETLHAGPGQPARPACKVASAAEGGRAKIARFRQSGDFRSAAASETRYSGRAACPGVACQISGQTTEFQAVCCRFRAHSASGRAKIELLQEEPKSRKKCKNGENGEIAACRRGCYAPGAATSTRPTGSAAAPPRAGADRAPRRAAPAARSIGRRGQMRSAACWAAPARAGPRRRRTALCGERPLTEAPRTGR